jgi:branched-chain amino acid transport system substrate-binding protein
VAYADGERAYIDFVNANGGVGGREVELLWQDYQYDVATAEQLYSQFVSEGAVAFMGWGTGDTEALRARITADQVPFMSASLAETLIDPAETPYNFVPASTYSEQMRVALKYIADQGTPASVAVFHNDSPFGTSPLADGEKYIADNGLDITFNAIPMPGGATDYTGELAQAGDVDYVIIQNVPSPAATLVRDLVTSGNDAQVICLNWCGNEVLIELAGDDAEGVLAVQPFLGGASGAEGLTDIIATAGSAEAATTGYVHGWTAMRVMVSAIETVVADGGEVTGAAIAEALANTTVSTGGLSADISFSADSHAGMTGSPVQIVDGGAWQPLTDVIVP